jgi:hypothetical protein
VTGGPRRPGAQLADQALPGGLLVELGDVLRSELLGHYQVHLVLLRCRVPFSPRPASG